MPGGAGGPQQPHRGRLTRAQKILLAVFVVIAVAVVAWIVWWNVTDHDDGYTGSSYHHTHIRHHHHW